jgi:hypothetical protein
MKNRTGIKEAGSQVQRESGSLEVQTVFALHATMPVDKNLSSGNK